jgi:chromosome segregation ATPase
VKADCQDKNHTILDMSKDLKDLNSKMKRSKTNLRESVNNRRQARAHLEDTLALLKRQVDEVQKEIGDNEQELNKLENMLETESADFSKNRQTIIKRFKKTEDALVKSTELTDECSARLEVIKWICTKSDNCSLRRKAYVIRSSTLEKGLFKYHGISSQTLQNCFPFRLP